MEDVWFYCWCDHRLGDNEADMDEGTVWVLERGSEWGTILYWSTDDLCRCNQYASKAVRAKEGARWAAVFLNDKNSVSQKQSAVRTNLDEAVTVVGAMGGRKVSLCLLAMLGVYITSQDHNVRQTHYTKWSGKDLLGFLSVFKSVAADCPYLSSFYSCVLRFLTNYFPAASTRKTAADCFK